LRPRHPKSDIKKFGKHRVEPLRSAHKPTVDEPKTCVSPSSHCQLIMSLQCYTPSAATRNVMDSSSLNAIATPCSHPVNNTVECYNILDHVSRMTLKEPPISPPKTPCVFQTPPMVARKRKPSTVTPPLGFVSVQQETHFELSAPLLCNSNNNSHRKKARSILFFPPPMLPNSLELEGTANPFSKKIRPMHSPIAGAVNSINLDFMARLQEVEELTTAVRLPSRRTVAAVGCFPELEDNEPQRPRVWLKIKMRRRIPDAV
jgi:hypothetical protein